MKIKALIFLVAALLCGKTLPAQILKGSGLLYFAEKAHLDAFPPSEAAGSEIAFVIADTMLYRWSRDAEAWVKITTGKVYEIASAADTTTIASPYEGDVAYVDTSLLFLRSQFAWLQFSGGSTEHADGMTILGAGTPADPFRVNTDSLHTKMISMDGPLNHYLNPCEANIDLLLSGTLFYDSIRIGDNISGLITEDDEAGFVVVGITEWDGYATFTLSASNVTPGVYFPGIYYAGELLWADQVTVVAGGADTVTVFDPPGQDSILVTRVCGTEVSRDTISGAGAAGDNLGNHIAEQNLDMDGFSIDMEGGMIIGGTGTGGDLWLQSTSGIGAGSDDIIFATGDNGGDIRMRLKGSGLLGIGTDSPAAGFGLDVAGSLALRIRGGNTAARPTATSGGLWYNSDGGWHQGSNGTSWWYFPRTSLAGGIGTAGSVFFAGADGAIQQDNTRLFWDDAQNFLGVGTSSPIVPIHVSGVLAASGTASMILAQATTVSGATGLQLGIRATVGGGAYTGNGTTASLSLANTAVSTGSNLRLNTSGTSPTGNYGVVGISSASTTGVMSGGFFEANNGNLNIGVVGKSSLAKAAAANVGVFGATINTLGVQVGGWFGFPVSTPTWESAALIADNVGQTSPIFLGKDNGTTVFSIIDGGNVGIGAAAASPTARMHLPAGTTAASTAPLGFTSGPLLTTPEVGKLEFLTDRWYGTITTGTARKTFAFTDDITAVTTGLGTNDVPRWNGTSLQPSGITSNGSTLVDILGEYPFIPFYGAPDAGADGYVLQYSDIEGGIILDALDGYIPLTLTANEEFDPGSFNLTLSQVAGMTIRGGDGLVIFGLSNDNITLTSPQMVFDDGDGSSTWGQTGGESFFQITSGGAAAVNSNSIGLRAEWDSVDPIVTMYDTDIIMPNTGISTDNTDRAVVMDSGDAIRYKETCRARLTETTPTALSADASYRHVKSLTSANLSNFTATDSTLTYTGTETILAEIQYTGSLQYDESTFGTYGAAFRVFVGAAGYVESSAESIIITDAEEDWIVPFSGSLWVSLNPSDVVSLRANVTAGITANLRNLNFTVKSL